MIYFTADTHFGSERTLEFSRRPFRTVEEMDEILVYKWNNTVKENDIVYHLGDFGNYPTRKRLNGRINLLFGNYELEDSIHAGGEGNLIDKLISDYEFETVIYPRFKFPHSTFYLIHKPEDYNKEYFNLFGHIHKLCMIKSFGLNVGVDCHNFKPISLDEVMWYKNAIENHYDNNVFITK